MTLDRLAGLTHPADMCDPAIAPLVAEMCAVDLDHYRQRHVLGCPA